MQRRPHLVVWASKLSSAGSECARLDAGEWDMVPTDCFSRIAVTGPGAPARATVWRTEFACLREFHRLLGRDSRYRKLVGTMYLGSVVAPARARMVRAMYCFFRRLDDVLDGDLHTGLDPPRYVGRMLSSIKSESPCENDPSILLGDYVVRNLRPLVANEEHARWVMGVLLRTMQFDHQRMVKRRIVDEATLHRHLRTVFSSSLELALVVAGSTYRWNYFEDLIDAQVRLFTLRDLRKDMSRNLINMPADVLGTGSGTMWATMDVDHLLAGNRATHWIREQYTLGERSVAAAGRALRSCRCRRTRLVVLPVFSDLKKICRETKREPGFRPSTTVPPPRPAPLR